MAEPSGHTLLTQALRVMNQAIEANRDTSPWREIVAKTNPPSGPALLGVEIRQGNLGRIVDRYIIRVHGGRFEIVEHGRSEPSTDWSIAVEDLRRIVEKPDRYLRDPGRLPLDWLEFRLGIRQRPKRAGGWRLGRARRPR